jgi:VIT1/CCC1 family predicted Fe2+/Mn2+ transporter
MRLVTSRLHVERHLSHRGQWLRAAVLGANDGIVSTASLLVGVASAGSSRDAVITAGIAGLTAGAVSMALGEYVSVSSQRDSERADIARETWELENEPDRELAELTAIYQEKGLSHTLARSVAIELTEKNALQIHLEEELGINQDNLAQPTQAAIASAVSFALAALIPLLVCAMAAVSLRVPLTIAVSLACLGLLGTVGATLGGAPRRTASLRVLVGGAVAMGLTFLIGHLVGATIA